MKKPCVNCPFRKDTQYGWLGEVRITEILAQESFVCHKTVDYSEEVNNDTNRLQCAGHMLLKGESNAFVSLANKMGFTLNLKGRKLVFDNEQDCINHHKF